MLPLLGGLALRALGGAAVRGAAGAAVRGGGGALVRSTAVRGAGGGLMRGLGGAAVRGGGRGLLGGLGGAAVRGIGGTLVKSALGGLGKGKKDDNKQVSTRKLIPQGSKGGGGGALVKTKSTSIVRSQGSAPATSSDKKTDGGDLITELTAIKETLIKIKGVLGTNLANTLRDQRNQRILRSKQKASEKESDLEKKTPKKDGGGKLKIPKKKLSLFDMIWNFISNVLIGSLLNFLWNYIPQIGKMFGDISKGLTNTWQVLRLGIITLTTVFPKQIKTVAKLTAKIIGPPAKLIGKLLSKAGGIIGKLFPRFGNLVTGLIKGPLSVLIGAATPGSRGSAAAAGALQRPQPGQGGRPKVTGSGGGRAGGIDIRNPLRQRPGVTTSGGGRAGGIDIRNPLRDRPTVTTGVGGNKGPSKLVNRLKIFSKIFKRIPVIGALIGIGIDMALGETLGRAAAGAAGASIGSGIGLALGKGGALAVTLATGGIGILAAPVIIGASALLGSAVGDWAGKQIYDKVTSGTKAANKAAPPVEQKYAAGRVGGSSRTMPSRTASIQSKPAVATSKVSPDVENRAKEDVLKDEKSLERFKTLSSVFAGTPFVGQLLKMGIDIGMGAKVQKTQTDAAAQDLGFTIGKALEDDEFSVPGLNKRIIGPLSKNLTEWAKRKIFYEVKSREGLFPSIEEGKETPSAPGGGGDGGDGGDGGGGGGGRLPGDAPPEIKAFMEAIAGAEGGWNSVNPQKVVPNLTKMTISQAREVGMRQRAIKGSGALGAFQQIPVYDGVNVLKQRTELAGLNYETDLFSPENQTKITRAYLASLYGGEQKLLADLKKDPMIAARKLRGVWPSLPGGSQENVHSKGFLARYNKSVEKYKKIASGGGSNGNGNGNGNDPGLKDLNAGKKGKIFLHWNAASRNNPVGYEDRYHAVFTGDGNKHQKLSYSSFNTPGGHTAYRNSTGIGLAIAAMGGYNWDKNGPTNTQLNAMAKEAANVAKGWGYTKSMINVKNVMTHAEAGSGRDGILPKGDNYGPTYWGGDGDKTDLHKLSKNDPDGSGGDKIRNMIKSHMGGGYGFNHHALPFFAMGGGGHVVTSQLGMRNLPISPGMHMGVDITGTTGEKLQAFTDGTVEATSPPSPSAGYGNWVSWIDDKGIGHFYGHMNRAPVVKAGQKVKKGTILGELGSTGKSTGPHLHWEAATNPRDTGMPKNAVLSRFNPLSKYNKEAPFGGTITPDGSVPQSTGSSSDHDPEHGSPPSGTSGQVSFSDSALSSGTIYGDPAKGGGSGTRGKIVEYLTGDPNSPNIAGKAYDRAGHGTPDNYHDHVAFSDRQTAIDAYKFFKSKGVKVTEFKGFDSVGGHAPNSYHYSGLAFDIPGHQWGGSGPVGEKDYAGSRKVRALLNEFFGGSIPVGSGPPPADIAQQSGTQPGAEGGGGFSDEALSSGTIYGDPAKEFYTKEMANLDQLKQKPSYDQGGKQSIVMLPPMQGQSVVGQSGGKSPLPISGGLNNKEVTALSVRHALASALYKL